MMLFAEHPRYPHLHIHIVPRMSWLGENDRSAHCFRFLNVSDDEQVVRSPDVAGDKYLTTACGDEIRDARRRLRDAVALRDGDRVAADPAPPLQLEPPLAGCEPARPPDIVRAERTLHLRERQP